MANEEYWKRQAQAAQGIPMPSADEYVDSMSPTNSFLQLTRKAVIAARRRRLAFVLAFLAAVAACTWAGYEIGLTKGRGWRGALIDNGCTVVCRRIGI